MHLPRSWRRLTKSHHARWVRCMSALIDRCQWASAGHCCQWFDCRVAECHCNSSTRCNHKGQTFDLHQADQIWEHRSRLAFRQRPCQAIHSLFCNLVFAYAISSSTASITSRCFICDHYVSNKQLAIDCSVNYASF